MNARNPHAVQFVGRAGSYDEKIFLTIFCPINDDWYVELDTLHETVSRINMYAAQKGNVESLVVLATGDDIQEP